jgi:RHS repeat-associated protein
LRFAGQYYDQETGLHYNYHRYYDTQLGRYLRADPIGLAGGVNLYAYVQNNPVNDIDPYGLQRGRRGHQQFIRRQQTKRAREIRNLEKAIRQHDPSFRYEVLRPKNGRIRREEVDNLRDILRDHQSRRRAEFHESLKTPRERSRDRIKTLEDAIEQLEGISRQQRLTPERIRSIQKSIDNLRHQLNRIQEGGCPEN